jgi:tetratricopeptide (TPR) repeat protein
MATIAELFQAAIRCHQVGNFAQAETLYQQVIQADAAHAEAHHFLGLVAFQTGRNQVALNLIRRSIALNPENSDAHYNLGNVHSGQGRLAEGAECFQQALRLNPRHADASNNLGLFYAQLGQFSEAGKYFQQALAINPRHADAHNNLGNVFKEEGRLIQAVDCFWRALAINPNHADAHTNLGLNLAQQGQFAAAANCYRQALRINPRHKMALGNRALLRLLQGDFANGWPDFELRWARPGVAPRAFKKPPWDGSPLQGKTILVYAEQGLGDTIQFARYLPLVQRRGGKVAFECPPALIRLFAGIVGADQIIPAGGVLPIFHENIPLMSLPGLFGTTLATIPADIPYLVAEHDNVLHWRREMNEPASTVADACGLNIGIAWQGNPAHGHDRERSIPLKQFDPLAQVDKVRLVSLQVGPGSDQLKTVSFPVADLGSRFDPNSLTDLAAVVENMDLVVTVDTSVAHLAGAMGVPVWVLLPVVPDWRWLLERTDSPWYPTMRLFRQRQRNDWDEVFARINTDLRLFRPGSSNRS